MGAAGRHGVLVLLHGGRDAGPGELSLGELDLSSNRKEKKPRD